MLPKVLPQNADIVPFSQYTEISDSWYAIYTKSRFEKKVFQVLTKAHYKAFLPLVKERKYWSDRIKSVMVPLLPSYVFVSLKPQHHPRLYYYSGIVTVVSFEGKPCAIREEEIRLMERIVMSGYPVQQTVHVTAGDNVRIVRGPLRGWEGRVDAMSGQSRITFQFDSIRQSISVEVNKQDIQII